MSGYEQRFAKGEIIIKEGMEGDRTYFIKSGSVLVCKSDAEGNLVPIRRLKEGQMFGEMYIMHENRLRNATVVAAEEVVTEVDLESVIAKEIAGASPLLKRLLSGTSGRLNMMNDSYMDLKGTEADKPENVKSPSAKESRPQNISKKKKTIKISRLDRGDEFL